MKTEDFEKAIPDGVTIEEMKLTHSKVRVCIGHTDSLYIEWDEFGRAFSKPSDSDSTITRDHSFDLKFE